MYSYIDQLDFSNMNFVPALRKFLEGKLMCMVYEAPPLIKKISCSKFEQLIIVCSLKITV